MLEIGQSTTVTIRARPKWNDTGLLLSAGAEYLLVATGQWKDWRTISGADGYESTNWLLRRTEWLRRARNEKWFALIGCLDPASRDYFLIGTERTFTAPRTGTLRCFANDVGLMYWNNSCALELTVSRLR